MPLSCCAPMDLPKKDSSVNASCPQNIQQGLETSSRNLASLAHLGAHGIFGSNRGVLQFPGRLLGVEDHDNVVPYALACLRRYHIAKAPHGTREVILSSVPPKRQESGGVRAVAVNFRGAKSTLVSWLAAAATVSLGSRTIWLSVFRVPARTSGCAPFLLLPTGAGPSP